MAFAYPARPQRLVLKEFSLQVAAGTSCALVRARRRRGRAPLAAPPEPVALACCQPELCCQPGAPIPHQPTTSWSLLLRRWGRAAAARARCWPCWSAFTSRWTERCAGLGVRVAVGDCRPEATLRAAGWSAAGGIAVPGAAGSACDDRLSPGAPRRPGAHRRHRRAAHRPALPAAPAGPGQPGARDVQVGAGGGGQGGGRPVLRGMETLLARPRPRSRARALSAPTRTAPAAAPSWRTWP